MNLSVISELEENDIVEVKKLIQEYINWINIDLSFQDIETEMFTFPGKYQKPDGIFLVAKYENAIVGCVGYRKINNEICEMKRLYVKDEYKGKGIGASLIKEVMKSAKNQGYRKMRLDTLEKMESAIKLYKRYGFHEIEQYINNPINGAKFMEKELTEES